MLLAHAGGAGLALLIAPILLATGALKLSTRVHQYARDVYVVAVVVGGLGGLGLATQAWGGPLAQAGFACMGIAWLGSVGMIVRAVVRSDEDAYDAWLLRSLALTFAGVTLRLWVPILASAGLPFVAAYGFGAWWAWIPNLFVVELWLRGRLDPLAELAAPAS